MDDDLRAFLHARDPRFSDLVAGWDLGRHVQHRMLLLMWYCAASATERRAWDELKKLLRTLLRRPESIPPLLTTWAVDAFGGRLPRPRLPDDGRPPEPGLDERNARIYYTFRSLRRQGVPYDRALKKIGEEMMHSPEGMILTPKGVESAIKDVKDKGLLDEEGP